jgi:hypothetical protein
VPEPVGKALLPGLYAISTRGPKFLWLTGGFGISSHEEGLQRFRIAVNDREELRHGA